jgi:Uma2 family endonuclease
MSTITPMAAADSIVYPESDGQPMAENTLQFEWIVTVKEGLAVLFRDRPDVFVAGDLLWYPVQGLPKIRVAPDAMVAFGRPKGYRGSYLQWKEDDIPPQVVFEILSPGNRDAEMLEKRYFYEKFGVQEYYIYDPELNVLEGWRREGPGLVRIDPMAGWVSPWLGITFDWSPEGLRLIRPDGKAFETFDEVTSRADSAESLVAQARQEIAEERRKATQAEERAEAERNRAEAERNRAEALEGRLRQLLGDDFNG